MKFIRNRMEENLSELILRHFLYIFMSDLCFEARMSGPEQKSQDFVELNGVKTSVESVMQVSDLPGMNSCRTNTIRVTALLSSESSTTVLVPE